jgi:sugar phosphate isomerase/epimerase
MTPLSSRREFLGSVSGAAAAFAASGGRILGAPAAPPPRPGWTIGCYTRPWGEHDYRVALDAIAEAGYKHVGLMTAKAKTGLVISTETTLDAAHKVGEEVKNRGLVVPSLYAGGIPIEKSLQAGIEGMKILIDNCAAVGAKDLMMAGVGEPKLHDPYYKAIAETCGYAAEKKIGISVKPHGGTNATGPQCRKVIEEVGRKNFGLWYDPGNIFFYSEGKLDPVADAATVDGIVVGMSVKDYKHPKDVMVTPGTGQVNFPAVLARLKKGGFTAGPLVVETLAPGDLPALLKEARKARLFLEEIVAAKP